MLTNLFSCSILDMTHIAIFMPISVYANRSKKSHPFNSHHHNHGHKITNRNLRGNPKFYKWFTTNPEHKKKKKKKLQIMEAPHKIIKYVYNPSNKAKHKCSQMRN